MKFPSAALASSTFAENAPVVRDLIRIMRQEIELHRRHAQLLAVEEKAIVQFQITTVASQSAERAVIVSAMEELARERAEQMKRFPEWRGKRLSQLVQAHCHPNDILKLMPLIEEFRSVAQEAGRVTSDAGHFTQFALNLVNGSISIFRNASNNVLTSYTPSGKIREVLQPAHATEQGTLTEV